MPDWVGLITSGQQSSNQQAATDASTALGQQSLQQQGFWNQVNYNNQQPFLQNAMLGMPQQQQFAGKIAGLTPQTYQQDPYNAFLTQQGIESLSAGSAAKGNFGSGNMGTALTQFGQQQAGQGYQQQLSNYMNQYNVFANMAAGGAGVASSMAAGNQSTANANSNIMGQMGNTIMAGAGAQNQIIGSNASNQSNQMMGGLGSYLQFQQNQSFANALANMNKQQPTGADTWGSGQNYSYDTPLS